jgi:hypothetical protein
MCKFALQLNGKQAIICIETGLVANYASPT